LRTSAEGKSCDGVAEEYIIYCFFSEKEEVITLKVINKKKRAAHQPRINRKHFL